LRRFRVQALNEVGVGPESAWQPCRTFGLPPQPPALELVAAAPSSLKLRWAEAAASPDDALSYVVELENRAGGFSRVFDGQARSCKVLRLHEHTQYRFRLRAIAAQAGPGPWSTPRAFRTALAAPPAVRGAFLRATFHAPHPTPPSTPQTNFASPSSARAPSTSSGSR